MTTQFFKDFIHHNNSTEKIVLATIIETIGSAYQKAGTRMLISENGELTGILSGGCFEADLFAQAATVFETGIAKDVFYDMRTADEAIWGLGLGCDGAVRIFLQLLTSEDKYFPLARISQVYDNNSSEVFISICDSSNSDYPVGSHYFLTCDQLKHRLSTTYTVNDIFYSDAQQVLLDNKSQLKQLSIDGHKMTVFYDILRPPLRLLLVGAGPDVVPVTKFAKLLGWHVTVIDHRLAYIQQQRFPDVDRILNIIPSELELNLPLDQFDALVVMTHNIEYDQRYLQVIADSQIPYIGLLGPVNRRDRLLNNLGQQAEKLKDRLHGPVGLDIGARTPEEIALAIVAEIQSLLQHKIEKEFNPLTLLSSNSNTLQLQDYAV